MSDPVRGPPQETLSTTPRNTKAHKNKITQSLNRVLMYCICTIFKTKIPKAVALVIYTIQKIIFQTSPPPKKLYFLTLKRKKKYVLGNMNSDLNSLHIVPLNCLIYSSSATNLILQASLSQCVRPFSIKQRNICLL